MRVFRSVFLLACLNLASASGANTRTVRKTVSIDDVVGYAPEGRISPIWSHNGKEFIYVEQDKVYRYNVAGRSAKVWFEIGPLEKLAKMPEPEKGFGWQNRRVSSDSYQWFPDDSRLLGKIRGDLFIIGAHGQHEQLTSTPADEEDAKLSPNGKSVLYRSHANLFVLDIATKKVQQLTSDGSATLLNGQLDWVYPEELDLGTASWWSPDSRQIAYLQFDIGHEFLYPHADLLGERAIAEPERYPQAGTPNALVKLGVIPMEGGPTRWMQLGETSNALLARVAWLPDGNSVAVERLSRLQDRLELIFCDPRSGAGKTVLEEKSKTWINLRQENLFLLKKRPEFLWISERSGFDHIYRYSQKGELLGQVTSGEWQVNGIEAIDEQNGSVLYTSTEASPLQAQLYRVSINGGQRTQVGNAPGTHTIRANPQGDAYLDTFSNVKEPPETVLCDGSGERLAVLRAANRKPLEEFDILPSEFVTVHATDGTVLYGRLIKPAGFQSGNKYPLIVNVYGGPGAQSVRDAWPGLGMEQVYAHHGFLVWQLDGRGSTGRGHVFEAPIFHELGKQEVADQRLGVEYLIQQGLVDSTRVGITGWSYGGYMTIRCLLMAPDVFRVGVAGAPVTDWHNYDTIYTERYMGLPNENAGGYTASSNVAAASRLQGKLLMLHNLEDDNVLFQNTMQMAAALEKAGKQYFLQLYPQKTHGVSGPLRKPLYQAMLEFFDQNLRESQ